MKKGFLLFVVSCLSLIGFSQIPAGYYDNAQGKVGDELRTALFNIIKGHSTQTYSSLHNHFSSTDKKSNGKVWDMYSDKPGMTPSYEYNFTSNDQCGNYSGEGDCYNREHSFPQSWFNSASPMQSDLFHVYPTDGFVNGKRANFAYGNVAAATWTSTNGSKLGTSAVSGYIGTVFEPIDEYKGDFARSYFYMVTRYKDKVSNWNSDMLTGDNLSSWATDLLVQWSDDDPVSTKETDRNNAVYNIQNNRNPYIDKPQYIDYIWGSGVLNVEDDIQTTKITYNNNRLTLSISQLSGSDLTIYSILGELIENHSITAKITSVNLNLNSGIYLVSYGNKVVKFVVN